MRRQRALPLVDPLRLEQHLVHQLPGKLRGQHPETDMVRQSHPRWNCPRRPCHQLLRRSVTPKYDFL